MRISNWTLSLAMAASLVTAHVSSAAESWGLKPGAVELKSAGALAFGPDGVLFVGDTAAAAIHAVQTADAKSDAAAAKVNVAGLPAKLAKLLSASEAEIKVNDMAVNPSSGCVYLSVEAARQPALVKIDTAGQLAQVSLKDVPHARAELADAPDSAVTRRGDPRNDAITDLVYREGKLLVAGMAKGQASSVVREFTFPFGDGATATNIEIYHAAHGRVEDNATVRAFVPLMIDGEASLLAGFTCTPLVRFPIKALEPGKKTRGTTVAELGNRNRPLDMVVYKKDGKSFVLMANSARGVMKISMANIEDNRGLTEPVKGGGVAGQPFETIKELQGVEHLDLLSDTHAVVLARSEKGSLDLSTVALP